jgi:hypothetical protein
MPSAGRYPWVGSGTEGWSGHGWFASWTTEAVPHRQLPVAIFPEAAKLYSKSRGTRDGRFGTPVRRGPRSDSWAFVASLTLLPLAFYASFCPPFPSME